MKIIIGSDHAGLELKFKLISHLRELGFEVEDQGAFSYNEEDDYTDFVKPVAAAVVTDPTARGIVIGKSGQGEAMCANRVKGVRAAVFYGGPLDIVRLSREHNDANILSLAGGFIDEAMAKVAVSTWLEARFSKDDRHIRRNKKLDE